MNIEQGTFLIEKGKLKIEKVKTDQMQNERV